MIQAKTISADDLKRCPIYLRTVCRETLDYIILRDAIRDQGLRTALLVRPMGDGYEVVDGAHRFEICLDLRIQWIPCIIQELTDEEVREAQITAHATSIETMNVDYARSLWYILNSDKSKTIDELAASIKQHPDWIRERLNLVNLCPRAQKDLTSGHLSGILGMELCKLSHLDQDHLLDLKDTITDQEFHDLIIEKARHYRQNKKEIRTQRNYATNYRLRTLKEIAYEIDNPTVAASVLLDAKAETKLDVWKAALEWARKNDLATVANDREQRERDRAKEAAKLERRTAEHLNRKRDRNE